MSDLKNEKPVQPGAKGNEESEAMQRLQRDADKMADKGRKEEERDDEDQGIFNKM